MSYIETSKLNFILFSVSLSISQGSYSVLIINLGKLLFVINSY